MRGQRNFLDDRLQGRERELDALRALLRESIEWLEFSTPEEYQAGRLQAEFVSRVKATLEGK